MELDEAVHGFGAAVVGAAGVEVAEELAAPFAQGAPEACDLGEGAGGVGVGDALGDAAPGGVVALVVDRSHALGAAVGDLDLEVALVGEHGLEA